jgi:KDO2-lipid IV(A) lauroyltransferase
MPGGQARAPRWHPRGLNNAGIMHATYYGVSYLPAWLTRAMGWTGTWVAYHLQRSGTRALIANFAVMFPELDEPARRALALRTYRSYARDVIDFIRSLRLSAASTRRLVGRFDTATLERAMVDGRGAILLSGHFGNWEIGGVLLRRLTPYALSVVAHAEPSRSVTDLRQDIRRKLGIRTVEVRQQLETALDIRARLQKNEIVAMLLDRHLGKDRVDVSFFGRPTRFLRTPAVLAALSGAPLVPCFVYRDEQGIAVECGPLITVDATGDRDAAIRSAIQQVAGSIEDHVRQRPHCWYQFYPFWPVETVPAAPQAAPALD